MDKFVGSIYEAFDRAGPLPATPFKAVACEHFRSHQDIIHLKGKNFIK